MSQLCPSFRIHQSSQIWLGLLFPMVGIMLFGSPLMAQRPELVPSTYTLAVGSLRYEPSLNTGFPMLALRYDRASSRWMRFETSASFSRPDVQTDLDGAYDPTFPTEKTNLFTLSIGAQARWTFGRVEPYGGAAAGIFVRRDGDSDGRRFSRTVFAFPFGIRVKLTDHLGIRGEIRFREDGHEFATFSDRETTVGVSWTR